MIEEMRIRYNQEEICTENRHPGCCEKTNKSHSCIEIIIAILAALFIGVVGLIIGAAFSLIILLSLPAVIVLAVILFLLLVLSIIVAVCCRKKKTKKICCCR